ncbi:MAG: FAD:protein FMN transferase [Planctomycetota bacterium]|jgi:thiamine biosynthesis lipoprotein
MTQPQPEISFVQGDWDSLSDARRFSREAMATTFEIIILHEDALYARQAAFAAFDELNRLEQELSRFIENSDISRINNIPANQPLPIGLDTFECLRLSAEMYDQTNGAFDITIGSLFGCWLNEDKTLRHPSKEQLELACRRTGTPLLKLDETEHTVTLLADGVRIDLGAVGKGYAIDKMAELLHDWSIDTAVIHGGFSSVLTLAAPPNTKGWPLTLSNPADRKQSLACLSLQNRAVSGSGLQQGRHIIDPRTAQPVTGRLAAWASASNAATSDALSTAFMVMTPSEAEQYCLTNPDTLALIVLDEHAAEPAKSNILRFGPWEEEPLKRK